MSMILFMLMRCDGMDFKMILCLGIWLLECVEMMSINLIINIFNLIR